MKSGFILFFIALAALASIPIQKSAHEKKNYYIDRGVFIGGYDRGLQTLDAIRENFDKDNQVERIVLDISPKNSSGRPGFFHISVQNNLKRVLIDLQNIGGHSMSEAKLKKIFEKSPYISSVKVYLDEHTKNLTLELAMKVNLKVEVFELISLNQPGRIVIDTKRL